MSSIKKLDTIDAEIVEERWDKKKIFLGLIILGILVFALYQNRHLVAGLVKQPSGSVAGVSTNTISKIAEEKIQPLSIPGKESLQSGIDSLKQEAQNINISEIATSSPQIQKVINDMKALEGYPKDQAKEMCQNICNGL